MDKKILVDQLKELVNKFDKDGKALTLAMLIPVETDLVNKKYTLLFSAPWLDKENPKDAVGIMIKAIIDQVSSPDAPEFKQISRVTVIKTLDPFVSAITSAFHVSGGEVNLSNCNINGIQIENGIVLKSERPVITSFSGTQKVGRNQPCPCGSGEKYKKCCGK